MVHARTSFGCQQLACEWGARGVSWGVLCGDSSFKGRGLVAENRSSVHLRIVLGVGGGGVENKLIRGGAENTLIRGGVEHTLIRGGVESTLIRGGVENAILRMRGGDMDHGREG
jgi:hypothetical protein